MYNKNKLERSALLWCHTSSDEIVPIISHRQPAGSKKPPEWENGRLIGQRRAHDCLLISGRVRDGTVAFWLSLQMTAN